MRKKQKKGLRERHLLKTGICFEALEPRLLLSGSWGTGIDNPGPDTPADVHDGLAQGSVVFQSDSDNSAAVDGRGQLTPGIGRVDLLSRAPALNTLGPAVPALEASSASITVAPVTDVPPATPLADENDTASNTETLAETVESAVRRELVLVNANVAANGPKTAPIIAQNLVFAPLLSAINQRRNAHDIVIMEIIINPVMIPFLPNCTKKS